MLDPSQTKKIVRGVSARIAESSVPQAAFMCMWATLFMILPYITDKGATPERHCWPKTEMQPTWWQIQTDIKMILV